MWHLKTLYGFAVVGSVSPALRSFLPHVQLPAELPHYAECGTPVLVQTKYAVTTLPDMEDFLSLFHKWDFTETGGKPHFGIILKLDLKTKVNI